MTGCKAPRSYRVGRPEQKFDLLKQPTLYARTLTAPNTVLVADVFRELGVAPTDGTGIQAFAPSATSETIATMKVSEVGSAAAFDRIRAQLYPVTIDGKRAAMGTELVVEDSITIGGVVLDAPGRKVKLEDTVVTLEKVKGEAHTEPVTFDIGAGIGIMTNTSGASNNDVMGIFAAARGYPFGGWYTMTKVGDSGSPSYEYTAAEGAGILNRFSINFGISNTLGSDTIQDPALFLGLGFDISPQFAIVAGASWYELEDSLAASNDNISFFFGTTMSLRAVADLLTLKTNGFTGGDETK